MLIISIQYFCNQFSENKSKEESNEDSAPTDLGSQQQKKKLPLHNSLTRVVAQLEMKPLWDEFHELGTEMIVTKAGR